MTVDGRPVLVVENFREDRAASGLRVRVVRPSSDSRLRTSIDGARARYERAIAGASLSDPRLHSAVERRVSRPLDEVVGRLFGTDRPPFDAIADEYRLRTTLHIPYSWPRLPMWFAVAAFSDTHSLLRLSLRSHKRLRYPARYFSAAHDALQRVDAQFTGRQGSSAFGLRMPAGSKARLTARIAATSA